MSSILKKGVIIVVYFLFSFSCNQINGDYKELSRIEVHFVDKEISTFFSIDCSTFEVFFKKRYKVLRIVDIKEIEEIKKCLGKSRKLPALEDIDVRVKVYLYSDEELSSIFCFDQFGKLVLNNKEYVENKCFVDFINNKIDLANQ